MRACEAWIDGRRVTTAERLPVIHPADESVVGDSAVGDPELVERAVSAAVAAFPAWAATAVPERRRLVEALIGVLEHRRDELVTATVDEVGAPVSVAGPWHVDLGIEVLRSSVEASRSFPFEHEIGHSLVVAKPVGVAALITPWNYPVYQLVVKLGSALLAGCTVVIKPAELTPLTADIVLEACGEAGIPGGVVNLVPGLGSIVGDALVADPRVAAVSFTGSTTVGRQIGVVTSRRSARACLELGGKSSSIVCRDADLAGAVRSTVEATMVNSGQTCSAWTRLLVPADRYVEALAVAEQTARSIVVGDPRDPDTQIGPLVSEAHRAKVVSMVEAARRRGARVVCGIGVDAVPSERGWFAAPTVVADLDSADPLSQEEVFGPVLVVHPCRDDAEAISIANDTSYGLGGAVWSADPERALDVARRLETGQVDINGAAFNPAAPFGGWKSSGQGRELGSEGLREFLEFTSIQR